MELSISKKTDILSVCMIIIVGIVIYYSSLMAPWVYDDYGNIVGNLDIYDIGNSVNKILTPRGFVNFTFSVNYYLDGLNVFWYHVVNVLIHIMSGLLVFWIFINIFRVGKRLSLLCALVFVSHPVQTQAVTYIVQRSSTLSCLLVLVSLCLYFKFRRSGKIGAKICYCLSLLLYLLALCSKQNVATYPVLLFCLDYYFICDKNRKFKNSFTVAFPFVLLSFLSFVRTIYFVGDDLLAGSVTAQFFELNAAGVAHVSYSPDNLVARYLFTEFQVVWIYIKLFFMPTDLRFEYCYPLVSSLLDIKSLAGAAGLMALVVITWKLRNSRPRIAIGLAWFFLLLLVESSVIPLDPIFEHRMYLPMIGLILIVADLSSRVRWERGVRVLWVACIMFLSVLTFNRNSLWASPVDFWKDNICKIQECFRPYYALGEAYKNDNDFDNAITNLDKAETLNPQSSVVAYSLGSVYAEKNDRDLALTYLKKAYTLNPKKYFYAYNLGVEYEKSGDYANAEKYQKITISLAPDYANSYFGLGNAIYFQGRKREALDYYRKALALNPSDKLFLGNFISVCYELGQPNEATAAMSSLKSIDPQFYNEVMEAVRSQSK